MMRCRQYEVLHGRCIVIDINREVLFEVLLMWVSEIVASLIFMNKKYGDKQVTLIVKK